MQQSPTQTPSPGRGRLGFAIQLAVLALALLGLMQLPRHFGEAPIVGAGGVVIGWHG